VAGPRTKVPTPKQLAVLRGIARGLTSAEIAVELGITPHTARTHAYFLQKRMGARNRAHAVALGYDWGLLPWVMMSCALVGYLWGVG
jgi:DNA-binding CsgD family transcriptional regulator